MQSGVNQFQFISTLFKDLKSISILCKNCIKSIKGYYSQLESFDIEILLINLELYSTIKNGSLNEKDIRTTHNQFNFNDKELYFNKLEEIVKQCKTKDFIKFELKLLNFGLEEESKKKVEYLFYEEYIQLKDMLNQLFQQWDIVFDFGLVISKNLTDNDLYSDLLKTKTVILYLSDIINTINEYFIKPIESELVEKSYKNKETAKRTFNYLQDNTIKVECFFKEFSNVSKTYIKWEFQRNIQHR